MRFKNLVSYIEKEQYRGYDPYDLLKSPFFKLPILKSNQKIRFLAQQLGKRLPINIRPLLFVPKGYNPVTLGLCIQAYTYLWSIENDKKNKEAFDIKIKYLIDQLELLIPKGFSGACWGYDFPWAARHANIPAYQPTVVATGIITNALFECYRFTNNEKALALCISASDFVKNDLKRTETADGICFSYSPFDTQQVFNASMKGVRLLAQVYSVTKNTELLHLAHKGANFLVKYQLSDGSWPYSLAYKGNWVDNYHTAYNLDCLDEYIKCTENNDYTEALKKGYFYYCNNFFTPSYLPKFYNTSIYPLDCTAAGQSLLTLCRFGDIELANKVANAFNEEMQNAKRGYFYFRKHKYYSQKTSYMRWSNAWMFVGMAYLKTK